MPVAPDAFADPVWNALRTSHSHLAVRAGLACKYPIDVSPFAAVGENTAGALFDLHGLLLAGESTYITGPKPPAVRGVHVEAGPLCLQMAFPAGAPIPEQTGSLNISQLTCADASAMVALTDAAFPGFFRARTCLMGSYYGIRSGDQLIAMAGERLCPFPFREVSGVCTHPDHRGKGYAAVLIARILAEQRRIGALSALHVAAANVSAIQLYERLGFISLREIELHRVTRVDFG